MAESLFIRADEVIRLLGVSKSEAYRIIKRLNDEMASKGYIKQDAVLPGGISLHTNFLRICSFLLCKHPYKFYLKIVSKKLLRDDL